MRAASPRFSLVLCTLIASPALAQGPMEAPAVGPVLSQRFPTPAVAFVQAVPADSAGSFVASALLGSAGAAAGFFAGFLIAPVGLVVGPVLGAGWGARIADRATGGAKPSFLWSTGGAALGFVAGAGWVELLCAGRGACRVEALLVSVGVSIGVGAAVGIAMERWLHTSADSMP